VHADMNGVDRIELEEDGDGGSAIGISSTAKTMYLNDGTSSMGADVIVMAAGLSP
jgi:hypothetical protein